MTSQETHIFRSAEDLPQQLPIFPLEGVLLLPGGQLPLNIFEDNYLRMVEDALSDSRLIGIIQPRSDSEESSDQGNHQGDRQVFDTGCAGKITSFSETSDGRYEVVLTGLCRFEVNQELSRRNGYRCIRPVWRTYCEDLAAEQKRCLDLDRDKLYELLNDYFDLHDLSCSWESIKATPDSGLITALSMICPLAPSEKQCLLEAQDCKSRAEMFMTMLELAIHSRSGSSDSEFPRH